MKRIEILHETGNRSPRLSFVLLDWSVRESFHMLDYIANQDIPRDSYEVIWIEYYGRRAVEIDRYIDKALQRSERPPVDLWIRMNMPPEVYYHKHLMYNLGILAAKGDIVCFCDSDAAVTPRYAGSIIKEFEENAEAVIHLEEVRSADRSFYPFNHPAFEEIERTASNMVNGKPLGLVEESDPLHTLNYGACMCALREDLIAIGGADEHIDYLGHICGPYDMTFRLVNMGRREIWHQREWLYHTWHPGAAGDMNYSGPHDGLHVSTRAREARKSGRVMPLVENPAIRMLRLKSGTPALQDAIRPNELERWIFRIEDNVWTRLRRFWLGMNPLEKKDARTWPGLSLSTVAAINAVLYKRAAGHARDLINMNRARAAKAVDVPQKGAAPSLSLTARLALIHSRALNFIGYEQRMVMHDRFNALECAEMMRALEGQGVKSVALYGASYIAELLCIISRDVPVSIIGVYGDEAGGRVSGREVMAVEELKGFEGTVLMASFVGLKRMKEKLLSLGIDNDRIIELL